MKWLAALARTATLVALVASQVQAQTQSRAAIQAAVDLGWDHFYNLELEAARSVFEQVAARNPDDPDLQTHVAQAILYREMLRAGALETELVSGGNAFLRREKMNPSAADRLHFEHAVNEALRLSEAAIAKNPNDTAAYHALGVAYGVRANYRFLVTHSWIDALRDASAARRAHERILEIDPKNVGALLVPGTHEYVIGSLSWHYRALGFLAGFHGSKESGIRKLQRVAREGTVNKADAMVFLATIYRRERRPREAVALLQELVGLYPRNYLFHFEMAQMYSDLGDKANALAAVAEVERLKRAGTPGYEALPDEKILYYRATIQFWYRDYPEALAAFRRVTAKAAVLDPNTGVTAWMRLGQTLDVTGQRSDAMKAYREAMAYAPESGVAQECAGYLQKAFVRTD